MKNQGTSSRMEYFGKDLEAMSFAKNYHEWIFSEFCPYLGETVAEVGAGNGGFSKILLQASIKKLFLFEPSHNMYQLLVNNFEHYNRISLINNAFDYNYSQTPFDSILYINVLEHIKDDELELKNAFKGLARNGYLLIFVPALQWLFGEVDRQVGHFRRYYKNTLLKMIKNIGFSIIKARYFDLIGIVPWYINFVLLNNNINPLNVNLYDKLVVPVIQATEKYINPILGKNILIVAQKQ